jgi:hypothetical protein
MMQQDDDRGPAALAVQKSEAPGFVRRRRLSRNPAHFNKNLASCLALWDWMFGTLYVPSAEPEKLEFGVEPDRAHAHTIRGEFIAPFGRAARLLTPLIGRRSPDGPVPDNVVVRR